MAKRILDLKSILLDSYSILLLGPRGTGKTFLSEEILKGFKGSSVSISLLDIQTFRRYNSDPSQFKKDIEEQINSSKSFPCIVLVDEIQKLPELLDYIHLLIEKFKGKVSFLLTGSSARKIKRSGVNLLAGRAISKRLYPFCSLELEIDLDKALQFGCLPRIYLNPKRRHEFLTSYVETYLKEEIQQEALTRNVPAFYKFLEVAGQQNSEIINYSSIAKQIKVADTTVKQYFEILSDTLVGTLLPAFDYSVRKQLTKSNKFYFFDCGVVNAICGEERSELKKATTRYGNLFETFIINEAIRYNDYLNNGFRLSYWRTLNGAEVDLVLSRKKSAPPIYAIEIKSSSAPKIEDLRSLELIREEFPEIQTLCFCNTPLPYSIGQIKVMPWSEGLRMTFNNSNL